MNDWLKGIWGAVFAAVLTAVLAAGGATYVSTSVNSYNQERLLQSTDKLNDAVTDLKITVGIQNEKFVTKSELANSLKEFKEEFKHGS